MAVPALRTPDERFNNIPGFDYAPLYFDDLPGYEGLRVHRVDEGPRDGGPVYLCLHGEPTWAFLFRKMIPVFLNSGARVVAPDWLGFGRSDKPVDDVVYGFHFHRNMILALIERLDLTNVTLVVQDWGGLLGLTLPHAMPDRISGLLVMNTALATGRPPGPGFIAWRDYVAANPDLAVGKLMKRSCPQLGEAEVAAYDAPFPDQSYKAGVRRFPQMVMTDPGMEGINTSKRALEFLRNDWSGQSFMAIGMQDPVLGAGVMHALRGVIRNCPEPMLVEQAGHFVQEWGDEIAARAIDHFAVKD